MLTLLAFLVTIGVLVVVHEFGHYWVARRCGVKVLRFAIGFGQPLYTRTYGEDRTEFVIAAFPLGGYVKMLDEREGPVAAHERARAYNQQNVWKRSAIVMAGPLANLLLAVVLYWVLFMSGVPGMRPILGPVPEGTPAAQASLKGGELITKVNGITVQTWQDVRWALLQRSFEEDVAEIEAIGARHESHLHRLSLAVLADEDFETDLLDKLGLHPARPSMPARIGEILEGGAAQRDGLQVGDLILRVDRTPVPDWETFVGMVRNNPGKTLVLEVSRGNAVLTVRLTPDGVQENGLTVGRIGAAYRMNEEEKRQYLVETRYSPLPALGHAVKKTWDTSVLSLKMLGSMVVGSLSWKGVSGPLTIASVAGQTAHVGWKAFIGFLALVSISLGVLNLLPIPMLDGGHLMYHSIEILRGKPVSERALEVGHKVGLGLLGLLMAIALYNDISRIVTS
ncbi:MAG: RIP metalloprotease RseP [Methylophilaceae bacterium]|nr:RIP metalloprotease RseP [Methylophilaceae bacterium]